MWLSKLGSMVFARVYVETPSLSGNTALFIAVPSGYRTATSLTAPIFALNGISDAPVGGVLFFSSNGSITYDGVTLPASVAVSWATCFAFWSIA